MTPPALDDVLAALVERHLERSLGQLADALARWRTGGSDVQAAHEAAMLHAARAQVLSARVARAAAVGADALLRDAVELGLLDEDGFRRLAGKAVADVPVPPTLDEEAAAELGDDDAPRPPRKRVVMDQLLASGPVLVQLDSRREGVRVPADHAGQAQLVLRFGWGLSPPIPDLEISDDGIAGTLAFGSSHFTCVIPWSAVFALVAEDGRGLFWPEDAPPEARAEIAEESSSTGRWKKAPGPADEGGPDPDGDDPPGGPGGPEGAEKPRRGHLRLV